MRTFAFRFASVAASALIASNALLPYVAMAQMNVPLRTAFSIHTSRPMTGVPTVKVGAQYEAAPPPRGRQNDTMLDEVGRGNPGVLGRLATQWRGELATRPSRDRAAWLNLWTGEALLAAEEPARAEGPLGRASRMSTDVRLRGIAAYDIALAKFYQGLYEESGHELRALIRGPLGGFSRKNAAMMAKHANACLGYHAAHLALGIPQPSRLDPLCGVSAVAIAARGSGLSLTRGQAVAAVPHHGMGSSLAELKDGAERLGLRSYAVTADEKGLQALPKPLVAHVEHDHFVAVTRADARGVSYVCSDCGPWPGGRVDLTWNQWRALEADAYLAVVKPGSVQDRALSALRRRSLPTMVGVTAAQSDFQVDAGSIARVRDLLSSLVGHASMFLLIPLAGIFCGQHPDSGHCAPGASSCPYDCDHSPSGAGPKVGDPVNLATGEEEYAPPADISVYNPTGPSISWRRIYNSLGVYTSGFGTGWSHLYNLGVEIDVDTSSTTGGSTASTNGGTTGTTSTATAGGMANGLSSNAGTTVSGVNGRVVFPNGSKASFSGSAPTSGTPHVAFLVPAGLPYLVAGDYDATTGTYTVSVTDSSRSTWTTVPYSQGFPTGNADTTDTTYRKVLMPVSRLADRVGNYVRFAYGTYTAWNNGRYGSVLRLNAINDSAGSALVTFGLSSGGAILSANDRYGRSVYYGYGGYTTVNVPNTFQNNYNLVNQVSQIVATGTISPPVRYQYGYSNYSNQEGSETVPYLHTISVPSPTGTGMSTATINYTSAGYVASTVDGNGNVTEYVDTSGVNNETTVRIKSPSGTVVEQESVQFDANMNETARVNGAGQTAFTKTYSSGSTPYRPSSVKDGNNRTWSYTWDAANNLLTATSPKGTTTTNTWSYANFALGELTSSRQGTKTATAYTYYEPSGLVHEVKTPIPGEVGTGSQQTTTYTYDSVGNLTQIASPGNGAVATRTTTFGYTTDGGYSQLERLGEPITVTDALGKVTHLRYDFRRNLTSSTDAIGNQTLTAYNLADQPTVTTLPATGNTGSGNATQTTSYLYVGGPATAQTLANEAGSVFRTTSFTYGAEGETLSQSGAAEAVTLTYTPAYRVASLAGGNGNATTYLYDLAGRPTQMSYPLASGTNYDRVRLTAYDSVGNVLTRVDGNGVSSTYTYADGDGRLTAVAYSNGYGSTAVGYDSYGRLISTTDAAGSSTISYDDSNNRTSSTRTYTGLGAQAFSYTYWPDGSRRTMVNLAGTWTYGYDAVGRYVSLASPAGTSTAAYLDNGWQSSRALPNGATTNYAYNSVGMLSGLANQTSGGANLSSYGSFAYDGAFNLTGFSATVPGAATQGGATSYGYDTKDRLTSEASARNGGYSGAYGYDASGNPTTFRGTAGTYDADDRRTGSGFGYDGNGNATNLRSTLNAFDPENRLTSRGSGFTAGYRADGLRAWKGLSGTRTYFLYDQGEPVVELDSTGAVTGINVFAPDGLVARKQGGTWTQYVFDPQGSVAQRLTAGQAVTSSSTYDAYGVETTTGAPNDTFGYNARWGYILDRTTGFYLCQRRYYDPQTARWLTRDPIGPLGGVNIYNYCQYDPIALADSAGLTRVKDRQSVQNCLQEAGRMDLMPVYDAQNGDFHALLDDKCNGPNIGGGNTVDNQDVDCDEVIHALEILAQGYMVTPDHKRNRPSRSPKRPFWRPDNGWAWAAGAALAIAAVGVLIATGGAAAPAEAAALTLVEGGAAAEAGAGGAIVAAAA